MNDRLDPMPDEELESRLAELATVIQFPATPNLAATVAARLRAQTVEHPAPIALLPPWRSVRRSLLLAAALVLLVVGGAFALRFGLELLSIGTGPLPSETPASAAPRPTPTRGASGATLGLGRSLTLAEARAATDFDVLVPEVLGEPDAVYLGGGTLRGQVAFVYAPRQELPRSDLLGGAGLLITQNQGERDSGLAHKIADTSVATIEQVDVDGSPGIWISGEPHLFWYKAPDGSVINESRRLVGDTLAWERDGILYRIEGQIPLSHALQIARSMR